MALQPTTYYAPEEIRVGSGLRIFWDTQFDFTGYVEPEPLPLALLREIERALAQRTLTDLPRGIHLQQSS